MSISSRLQKIVKTTILGLAAATSSMFFSNVKATAEVTYPLSNGQVVRFYLDNGQGINITNAQRLVNNGRVNSYQGSNTDPEQQFKIISDGSYYLFVRNNTNFGLSSSTLTPTPTSNSPMVSYTAGNGAWQNFVMDKIDADHFLLRWQANQNYCVNIPGGQQNVSLTFWPL